MSEPVSPNDLARRAELALAKVMVLFSDTFSKERRRDSFTAKMGAGNQALEAIQRLRTADTTDFDTALTDIEALTETFGASIGTRAEVLATTRQAHQAATTLDQRSIERRGRVATAHPHLKDHGFADGDLLLIEGAFAELERHNADLRTEDPHLGVREAAVDAELIILEMSVWGRDNAGPYQPPYLPLEPAMFLDTSRKALTTEPAAGSTIL